jgi:hypothetical protein
MFDREMRCLAATQRWLADYGLEGRDLRGLLQFDVFPEILIAGGRRSAAP